MSAIDDAVERGLKTITHRAAQKEADDARVAAEAASENREAWQAIVDAVHEALPEELRGDLLYNEARPPRSFAALGEVWLAPAVLHLHRCVPILAYSNGGPVRYKVQAPVVEWNEDAQRWVLVYAGWDTLVREYEYRDGIKDGESGWTDDVFIAIKRANELARIVYGLHYEVQRRNDAGERPPVKTAAQAFLEQAERHAPLSGDKALVYVLLAIAHKMID